MEFLTLLYFIFKIGLIGIAIGLTKVVIAVLCELLLPGRQFYRSFLRITPPKTNFRDLLKFIEGTTIGTLLYLEFPVYAIIGLTFILSCTIKAVRNITFAPA